MPETPFQVVDSSPSTNTLAFTEQLMSAYCMPGTVRGVFEVRCLCQCAGESSWYMPGFSQIGPDRLQPVKGISMSNRPLV